MKTAMRSTTINSTLASFGAEELCHFRIEACAGLMLPPHINSNSP